ncbi:Bacterial epsilon antitoxin protein [Dioscorea alata]|uniref:Bacterial epsilon antitoxin protein n=3 Tax=Dioscorea alata TaxID=55571 RepID=A0ACB7WBQ9_DIOAL|nr:Bacterial epsilon antitoxin protein [Dioscorea alata]
MLIVDADPHRSPSRASPMEPLPSSSLDFTDFLTRMRHPASADLFRFTNRFIVSFSLYRTNAENGSRKIQDFLAKIETMIREHPLWVHATDAEIENALEGLEKYVMIKLFNRVFAATPEDAEADLRISKKILLLQHFVKPDHLDLPGNFLIEASWLNAAKELKKINAFRCPHEKLQCIMTCCHAINDMLLEVSKSANRTPVGADVFLPILIYATIKANPPQLHSNLKFIQLFRRQSKLVSEVEFYLTSMISTELFIFNIDARSLSMEETEFQKSMESAKLVIDGSSIKPIAEVETYKDIISTMRCDKEIILDEGKYPFMETEAEDLTLSEVQDLLCSYKQLVKRYTMLSNTLHRLSPHEFQLLNSPEHLTCSDSLDKKGKI